MMHRIQFDVQRKPDIRLASRYAMDEMNRLSTAIGFPRVG
jgi:hypothetical protein